MSPGPSRRRAAGPDGRSRAPGYRPAAGARRWQLVRADPDAVPPSVRRFMQRARQRQMRAALPWAVAGGVAAIAALVAWVLLGTDLFGVREVRVSGAKLVTSVQVREAAGVRDGEPLARIDLAELRARVAELPPVEQVTVSRQWPDGLLIRVVERTGVAAVPRQDGRYAVIDKSGVVFQTVPQQPSGLPLIWVGSPGPDDPGTRAGLEVLAVLTPQLRDQLVEVTVEGLARITLRLRGDRKIIWGDATRGEAKARVATSLLTRKGEVIDVSAPEVVTIR